jgi:hypothetical protein
MEKPLLVALVVLALLGPGVLAFVIRRRRPAIPFLKAYGYMLPGFALSAALKIAYHLTGHFVLDVAAPIVMVVGVLLGVRWLER